MKAIHYIFIVILIAITLGMIHKATALQPYAQINQPTNLVFLCTLNNQVPPSGTTFNITISNSTSILLNNVNTTAQGNGNFNRTYTFTNLGQYTVQEFCYTTGYNFSSTEYITVNGSGQNVTSSQVFLIIIGIVVLVIVAGFFFLLSMLFKHPGTKIFLMSLSALTLIIIIGIIASNASVYLSEFTSLTSLYNTYYIIVIIGSGAAMAGLILWLIYYAVKLFNKSRGRLEDDD